MRFRSYLIFSLSVIFMFACNFLSLPGSNGSGDAGDGQDLSVEQRVEATTSARQTATVEIQQAIDNALTAAAPPPSDTPLPATQVFVPIPTNTLQSLTHPQPRSPSQQLRYHLPRSSRVQVIAKVRREILSLLITPA